MEGILEADPGKLATIVGSADKAAQLIARAKALLSGAQPPSTASPLDALGIDAATRAKLEAAGIRDVAGVANADPAKLASILGDRTRANDLIQAAKRLLAAPTSTITATPTVTPSPTQPRGGTTKGSG